MCEAAPHDAARGEVVSVWRKGAAACGGVVKNADGSQFLGQRVVSIIKPFFQFQDIVSSDDHQQLLVWDAQHLVRSQQPSAPLALRLTVLGDDLRYGNGLCARSWWS